jgi:S-adenosylmethionine synthetase
MSYIFTSESVSEGHPDKVADQISDAILDEFLRRDAYSRVACETYCTTGLVVVGGEVTSSAFVDVQNVVRDVVNRIGYTKASYRFDGDSCGVLNAIHEQSADISRGVSEDTNADKDQGAGDQGMMFGYAVNETESLMPVTLELSHIILRELAAIRREGKKMTYLGPDSKSQVSVEYNDRNRPVAIHTIVVSTQHDEFIKPKSNTAKALKEAEVAMQKQIHDDVRDILLKRVIKNQPRAIKKLFGKNWKERVRLLVNPTGKFVIGGPHGDVGLTGRKIIVDTYGGHGAHGGGAFSGKDPSKVDRSAAYAARHVAKNLVASGLCTRALVQVAYAIGKAQPVSVNVNTFGTCRHWHNGEKMTDGRISERVSSLFDMRPAAIRERFGLLNPIYSATAAYGHFGRNAEDRDVEFITVEKGVEKRSTRKVTFFGWERTDMVDKVRKAFGIEAPKEGKTRGRKPSAKAATAKAAATKAAPAKRGRKKAVTA